jgi:hypothetical protein
MIENGGSRIAIFYPLSSILSDSFSLRTLRLCGILF